MTNKPRVAIVGSGPSAMLACHAAVVSGWYPTMYSPVTRPQPLPGAQYLHSYVPHLQLPPPFRIQYEYFGTREGYAQKLYGSPTASCSWGNFGHEVIAWNLGAVLTDLWAQYRALIKEWTVQPNDVPKMVDSFEVVVNTAPLHALAPMGEYEVEHVWIANVGNQGMGPNEIHYYGDDRPEYRRSYIMGRGQVEYPDSAEPPMPEAKRIPKPLRARAHLPGVHLIGRYGKWKKGVLVDHAFQEAMQIFEGKLTWEESQVT